MRSSLVPAASPFQGFQGQADCPSSSLSTASHGVWFAAISSKFQLFSEFKANSLESTRWVA